MPPSARVSPGAIIASVILSLLCGLIWFALLATLADLGSSDPAGNGLAQGFAAIEIIVLWLLLGLLLLVSVVAGKIAPLAALPAVALLPASGVAAMIAMRLLSDHTEAPFLWPIITPALVPPLVLAFCFWALLPALRGIVPAGVAAGVTWGATLVLCLALWPLTQVRDHVTEQREALRTRWAAEFASVGPDAPLWEWTQFLQAPDARIVDAALERIRHLPRRQEEAEIMLARGDFPLRYLGSFDLDPTPVICAKARSLLLSRVQPLLARSPGSRPYADIAGEVADAVAAMEWLVGYGCSCDAESVAWESMAKGYRDPNFDVYRLAELRDPKVLGHRLLQAPDKFSMLTPQAHLMAWLKFASDQALREQALAGARRLEHRTDDAVEMLNQDRYAASTVLQYLPELDLEATATLCAAGLTVLYDQFTEIYRPQPNDPRPYTELLERAGTASPFTALRWLASHGCDADAALVEAEELVGAYQNAPEQAAMLTSLQQLHRKR